MTWVHEAGRVNVTGSIRRAMWGAALAAVALTASAGPASGASQAVDSWSGRCAVAGTLTFADAFGAEPAFTSWREEGSGTCTGVLNGAPVTRTPTVVRGRGSGTLTCLVGGTDVRLANAVTFTRGTRRRGDDVVIGLSGRSLTALGESVALMRGDVSGEALGHVDFLTTSGPDVTEDCRTSSVTSMSFRATTQTLSTMRG